MVPANDVKTHCGPCRSCAALPLCSSSPAGICDLSRDFFVGNKRTTRPGPSRPAGTGAGRSTFSRGGGWRSIQIYAGSHPYGPVCTLSLVVDTQGRAALRGAELPGRIIRCTLSPAHRDHDARVRCGHYCTDRPYAAPRLSLNSCMVYIYCGVRVLGRAVALPLHD